MTKDSDTQKKRAFLGGLMKLMFSVLILAVLWVGFSFVGSTDQADQPVMSKTVSLAIFKEGVTDVIEWEGRPVLVLKRLPEMVTSLQNSDAAGLRDARSEDSKQPQWAKSNFRSRTPEWFVAIASGSDFGCPVEYLPRTNENFAGKPWQGGFKDTCRGSRYDLAGRVYVGQNAELNLEIPSYRVEKGMLYLGGL